MKKILWLSRHEILPAQRKELERIFGDIEIIKHSEKVENDEHVINLIKKYNADEIVAVLPLSIIARIVERGIKPIFAKMDVVDDDFDSERDVIHAGRHYRFSHFERIEQIKIISKKLGGNKNGSEGS